MALQELREAILQCAEASAAAQAQIDAQWPALSNMTVPQELYAAMVDHQSACNGMLALKDNVISRMRNVLSKKEKEYMHTLKSHAEVRFELRHATSLVHGTDTTMEAGLYKCSSVLQAVDNVLGCMTNHANLLQQCCDTEMNLIDAALDEASSKSAKEAHVLFLKSTSQDS